MDTVFSISIANIVIVTVFSLLLIAFGVGIMFFSVALLREEIKDPSKDPLINWVPYLLVVVGLFACFMIVTAVIDGIKTLVS